MTNAPPIAPRTLGITATPHPLGRYGFTQLLINIDGVEHIGRWSRRGQWQIPADGPVAIAIAMRNAGARKYFGAAQLVLAPGEPTELEYKAPAFFSAPGDLGQRGTVTHNGSGSLTTFVVVALAISLVVVPLIILGAFVVAGR